MSVFNEFQDIDRIQCPYFFDFWTLIVTNVFVL